MSIEKTTATAKALQENVSKVIVGREDTIFLVMAALLSDGHVLLEDVPGTGKTLLAKALAASLSLSFKRIQFTPDLLPSDITGISIYNQKIGEFEFKKGSVFASVVLADEINRATPRTQAAMLEAMEERQVSAEGNTYPLPRPFMVIATQNPLETQGTFPLPEAQLDRFLIKTAMGYPSTGEGVGILRRFIREDPIAELRSVASAQDILDARSEVREVRVGAEMMEYIVKVVEATRSAEDVLLGASPRAALALMRSSQAAAALTGYEYVRPDDVKRMAPCVLSHRLICRRFGSDTKASEEIIRRILDKVEVPTETLEE